MFILLIAAYNKRYYLLIFNVILALYLKQSKHQVVLELLTNSTNYLPTNNDNTSNIVRPGQLGKLNTKPYINKETAAAILNRNAALLKAFAKRLAHKSTTIYSLGDNAYQNKLATILKKDSKEKKDNNAAKLKDNIFNTPTALEEYINLTAKAVEEGEDGLYFQVVNPTASLTNKELGELLD